MKGDREVRRPPPGSRTTATSREASAAVTACAGALVGAAFFLVVLRLGSVLRPSNTSWLMGWDWSVGYMGWRFFRVEPWAWPPARIAGLLHPVGTTVGFVDALPVLALPFKALRVLLPGTFQYVGAFLFLCYVAQGVFGSLLLRLLTPGLWRQAAGAALFVLSPALLFRLGHVSLSTHALLLAGIWAYARAAMGGPEAVLLWPVLCALAGGLHPYIALLVEALAFADVLRARFVSSTVDTAGAALRVAGNVGACLAAAWLSGYLAGGASAISSEGVGNFSMNLLSLVNPMGFSRFLPDLPVATPGQYEGFNYAGLGGLGLFAAALAVAALKPPSGEALRRFAPLLLVCGALALCALSPKVTLGSATLLDLPSRWFRFLAPFRSTGRLFWPMGYLLLFLSLALLSRRCRPAFFGALLLGALVLQAADLSKRHGIVRRREGIGFETWREEWRSSLGDPAWDRLGEAARRLVLLPPTRCQEQPDACIVLADFAVRHQLTFNSGLAGHLDARVLAPAEEEARAALREGRPDSRTIYLSDARALEDVRDSRETVCRELDRVAVCVAQGSSLAGLLGAR
ncbi:MAG: DUF6311 domain-containing protein [Acidobacteriota bacterium]